VQIPQRRRAIQSLIDDVIGHPAKGIERRRGLAHALGQDQRSGEERAGTAAQRGAARRDVGTGGMLVSG
jgi:hypothetical protein